MKKTFIGFVAITFLFLLASCKKDAVVTPQDMNSRAPWVAASSAPAGFDDPNGPNPIVGSMPYFVVFIDEPNVLNVVWTKNGTPASDANGIKYYGASYGFQQQNMSQEFISDTVQPLLTQKRKYVVVSHFVDGGPANNKWSVTSY